MSIGSNSAIPSAQRQPEYRRSRTFVVLPRI